MDETIYNRSLARDQQPVPKSRLLRLVGVEQWQSRHSRQTFVQALMRPVIAISKLPVLLCTIYYFLNYAWIIGVNTTISIWLTSIYKFTPYNLGKSTSSAPLILKWETKPESESRLLLLRPHHRRLRWRSPRSLAS